MKKRMLLGVIATALTFAAAADTVLLVNGQPLAINGGFISITVTGGDPYAVRAPLGTDLCLDTTAGSDGTGACGNSSGSGAGYSPWKTLSAVRLNTLTAGRALWARNGSSFQLPNTQATQLPSGTSGSHIIFAVWPSESATITMPAGGVAFGGGDYWDVARFTVSAVDTGFELGCSSCSGSAVPTNHWNFIDIVGTRSDTTGATTDNSGIIKADSNNDFLTVVRGTYTGQSGQVNNQADIWVDQVPNVKILGALVVGAASPIYFKHNPVDSGTPSPTGLVKNCIIRNAGRDFEAQRSFAVYQNNVFDNVQLSLDASGGGTTAAGVTLINNTFANQDSGVGVSNSGVTSPPSNNTLTSNVMAGSATYNQNAYTSGSTGDVIDYSAVAGAGTNHYQHNSVSYTLSAYHTAFSTQEAHGLAGTLSFVGGSSGGGATASGWALSASSFGTAANGQAGGNGADRGVNAANLLTVN